MLFGLCIVHLFNSGMPNSYIHTRIIPRGSRNKERESFCKLGRVSLIISHSQLFWGRSWLSTLPYPVADIATSQGFALSNTHTYPHKVGIIPPKFIPKDILLESTVLAKRLIYRAEMSQESAAFPGSFAPALGSASEAEKHARSTGETTSSHAIHPKPRSCVTCRSRKVRCDKKSPCSNCRRANIACVLPSIDHQPRWARRLQQGPSGDVMNRLRSLENLVKHLSTQLEEANAAASASGNSPGLIPAGDGNSADSNDQANSQFAKPSKGQMEAQFGRLVVEDLNRSRYLGNGFWSRMNDEVCMQVC